MPRPRCSLGAATWLPKRKPVAFWPGVSVMLIPAPRPEPSGRSSAGNDLGEDVGPAGIPREGEIAGSVGRRREDRPTELVSRIVTPETPDSPVSLTPLPLASLNFVPEIDPIAARLPKRNPVAFWPAVTVTLIVPAPPGVVWTNPTGTTSERV